MDIISQENLLVIRLLFGAIIALSSVIVYLYIGKEKLNKELLLYSERVIKLLSDFSNDIKVLDELKSLTNQINNNQISTDGYVKRILELLDAYNKSKF